MDGIHYIHDNRGVCQTKCQNVAFQESQNVLEVCVRSLLSEIFHYVATCPGIIIKVATEMCHIVVKGSWNRGYYFAVKWRIVFDVKNMIIFG